MTYLPNVRMRVDWDNDSFLNGDVPTGTPPNLIPNAAYAAGANAAYIINGAYFDGEFKDIDDKGFTTLECDYAVADKAAFGFKRSNYSAPYGVPKNWLSLSDYAKYYGSSEFKKVTPSVAPPVTADVYGFSNTTGGSNSISYTMNVNVPAGEYVISAWMRIKKQGASANPKFNISLGSTGANSLAEMNSPSEFATLADNTWSDWIRVGYYAQVDDSGDGIRTITATFTGTYSFAPSTTNTLQLEIAGLMLTEPVWQNYSLDNLTPVLTVNGTITWNGVLGTTGGYEIRGNGATFTSDLDIGVNWTETYFLSRITYTALRIGANNGLSSLIVGSGGTEITENITNGGTGVGISYDPTTTTTYTGYHFKRQLTESAEIASTMRFRFQGTVPNTNGSDIYDLNFEVIILPSEYYENPRNFATDRDIIMAQGNAYNVSFCAKHNNVAAQNITATVYGVSKENGVLELLETANFSVTNTWGRFAVEISAVADDYALYVEITTAYADVMYFKGFQLTEGLSAVAFNVGTTAPLDNIIGYVKSAEWKSGRNAFDDSIAYEGTLDVTLNNESRYFSIENTASPYYGLLRQNLKIVFEVYHLGVWYPIWSGWTRYFDVVAGTNSSLEVVLHAEQGIYRLREGSFSYAPTEDTRMDEVVAAIVHNSGWRSARSPFHTILSFDAILGINTYLQSTDEIFSRIDVGRQKLSLVGMDWGRETTPDKALQAVLEAEQAKLWIDREGGLVLVNRNHLINAEDKFTTDLTLDTEVQDASYNFGEGIVNRIQVMYEEKKEVTNAIIWQSKSSILVPKRDAMNIYRKSTVRFPLHFTFEEQRQRTITKINSRFSDFDITVTNATTGEVVTNTSRMIWASVTSDGGNRLELQLRNEFDFPVLIDITIYGNYLEGGQSQVVIVEDTDAQEYIQAIHEKIVETSVLSDLDTAVNLAKWDISRYANPRGEFRVIQTYVDAPEILTRLLAWELGTILKISELQTGETNRFHIIIAEEGSYAAGDTIRVTHRMARGDDNYYNKVGYSTLRKGTLNHAPEIDITRADMFGSDGAKTEKVSYISPIGDSAVQFITEKYNGAIWFGMSDAQIKQVVKRYNTRFAQYPVTNVAFTYQGIERIFLSKHWLNPDYILGTINPTLAFVNSNGSTTATNWKLVPRRRGSIRRFSVTYTDGTGSKQVNWDADVVNNLNSDTLGAHTKSESVSITTANSSANPFSDSNGISRIRIFDYILKMPNGSDNGSYVRVYGNSRLTDPVEMDLSKVGHSTLKENTTYYVTMWAGAELGETVDVEVVILEHDSVTEKTVNFSISDYGKYQGTITTTASLTDPTVTVFFRIKTAFIPVYIAGFAITETDVETIDEANTRQALAAHSFI